MANFNNLLRPPVLNIEQTFNAPIQESDENLIPQPTQQQRQLNRQEAFQQSRNMNNSGNNNTEEMEAIIRRLISEQLPTLMQANQNPTLDFASLNDEEILPINRANIGDLDKVPDVVKCLREFSGNPAEFNSWKKSVDRVLSVYQDKIGTAKYFGILHTIRNKIVGSADAALESYNIPLNWTAICKCLTLHYADKRDLSTLEYQMKNLIQNNNQTVEDFHRTVCKHLSLILNKIGCMELGRESERLMTKLYRDKALDTFIRGLRGDLSRLLGMKEPSDLPSALHLCLKLENQSYRSNQPMNPQGSTFNV